MTSEPLKCQGKDGPDPLWLLALSRWAEASSRLGLSDAARALVGRLVAEELSPDPASCDPGRAPTYAELLSWLGSEHPNEALVSALVELEGRGVLSPPPEGTRWLSAEAALSPRARAYCLMESPAPSPEVPLLLERVEGQLAALVARVKRAPRRFLVQLRGRRGSGRDSAALSLLAHLGVPEQRLTPLDLASPPDPLEPELSGRALVWDGRGHDLSPLDQARARQLLARSPGVAVVLLDEEQDGLELDERTTLSISLSPESLQEREEGWALALGATELGEPERQALASRLARATGAGPGLARRAVEAAGRLAPCEGLDAHALVLHEALGQAIRPSELRGIAVEHPRVSLEQLVVADEVRAALENTLLLARHAPELAQSRRPGVRALLAGPSGTGKTMAARALASSLGRPLYRVDLSSVVSKWIGETEKNLRGAFAAAEASGAVLLFDEGDALLGKRAEVSKGADRYANLEVSYLLQAIEAFAGVVVVTTNKRGDLDSAFDRRFDLIAEFTQPSEAQRAKLWAQELGPWAEALGERALKAVASKAELSGGAIAASARLASVMAAEAGAMSASVLARAIRCELMKQGSRVQAEAWTCLPRQVA